MSAVQAGDDGRLNSVAGLRMMNSRWIVCIYLEGRVDRISKRLNTVCGSMGGPGRKTCVAPILQKEQPGLVGWQIREGRASNGQE